MTQTPPADHAPPLSRLPLLEWGFVNCPAIPYWADEYGDPDLRPHPRDAGQLADRAAPRAMPAIGLVAPSTRSTARRTSRTSSSTAARWRRADRNRASPARPSWRSTSRRVHAAVDHVPGRVRGLAGPRRALRQDADGHHDRDAGLLADDRELRPAVQPPRPREGRRRTSQRASPRSSATSGTTENIGRRSRRPGSCTRST